MNDQSALFVKMAVQAWDTNVGRAGQLFHSLSDEQLLKEIAPGRNRGVYILGHLVAIHDAMNEILGLGSRAHAVLDTAFVRNSDNPGSDVPSIEILKQYWDEVHAQLSSAFSRLEPADWFAKHNAVSDADFEKDPIRNKLNVLINRTNHLSYHLGQLRLIK